MSSKFVYRRRVEFADTDMAGVLHFASYYRIMEEAEHAFWRHTGLSVVTKVNGREISWPRVATSCNYHASARFEDVLDVEVGVIKLGEKSATFESVFKLDGNMVARGESTAVCCAIDGDEFESMPIPPVLRSALEGVAAN